VAQQLEALALERKHARERPHVADPDVVALGVEEHARRAARVRSAVEHGLGVRSRDEGERGTDVDRGAVRGGGGSGIKNSLVHGLPSSVGMTGTPQR
jgi:hypothetical protein